MTTNQYLVYFSFGFYFISLLLLNLIKKEKREKYYIIVFIIFILSLIYVFIMDFIEKPILPLNFVIFATFLIIIQIFKIVFDIFDQEIKINTHLAISKIFLYLVIITLLIFVYKKTNYIKFDFGSNIDTITICWDECVIVELTESEIKTLEKELTKQTFQYSEGYLSFGWYENESSTIVGRAANIYINEIHIFYSYVLIDDERFTLAIKKDGYDYIIKGENKITKILDKYIVLNKDTLNNEDK